ncbi:hypothetical protein ACFQ4Y_10955 [Kroppenstedtia sanguinis]|uniref:Uncharacterized protein n=1 Tax=Kroppenstedtia sanguinis TaxID=1380684 RepID=A0ABW4CCD1_9BACL
MVLAIRLIVSLQVELPQENRSFHRLLGNGTDPFFTIHRVYLRFPHLNRQESRLSQISQPPYFANS